MGYLGPNGAGKTTTIRILMGTLRASSGRAEILGCDAWAERTRAHGWVGYLPGDFVADEQLTGRQYLSYLASLRGGAGAPGPGAEAVRLAERLGLDLSRRWGTLSSGNRQKLGIVQAFAHQPRLLVLDEPTKGLDPIVQREFLELVREARAAGRTVFLSSHDLSEVEQVADTVAILRAGRLIVVEEVGVLKQRARRRLDLRFTDPPPLQALLALPGVQDVHVKGRDVHLSAEGSLAPLMRLVAPYGLENVVTHQADLEEIFLAYYADRQERRTRPETGAGAVPAGSGR
jgi:ABC-2 type transport system ATP-binding protein